MYGFMITGQPGKGLSRINPVNWTLSLRSRRIILCSCACFMWHGGVKVTKRLFKASAFLALVLGASSLALAMEEQNGAAPQAPAGVEVPQANVQGAALPAKPETGTEIRIPGLGKLGTLPKMDFGLELLYGAADGKQGQDPVTEDKDGQDLTIRGSVKHNF